LDVLDVASRILITIGSVALNVPDWQGNVQADKLCAAGNRRSLHWWRRCSRLYWFSPPPRVVSPAIKSKVRAVTSVG